MRILIDECLPKKLKLELPDHLVKTVPEAGWRKAERRPTEACRAGISMSF
jgi:predicted nuclease of predicted toxin-antitoxin system